MQSTFGHLFEDDAEARISPEERALLAGLLWPPKKSRISGIPRMVFNLYSNVVPPKLRTVTLKPLRMLRNLAKSEMKPVGECSVNRMVRRLEESGSRRRPWSGNRGAVLISYDIDQKRGYAYLDTVIAQLEKHGLRATFHVLTDWEYNIAWDKIRSIAERGHEIGLHGARHDIGMGLRSRKHIMKELGSALESMPFKVSGYRAPALSMSTRLLDCIRDLGFAYDSSLPMSSMYYHSVESCFPYPIDGGFWEFPITLQDSTLFLDLKLSEDAALKKTMETVGEVREIGGTAVLNLHPYIAAYYPVYHESLLASLPACRDILICTHNDLYRYLRGELIRETPCAEGDVT